jgi:flavorubredoxin
MDVAVVYESMFGNTHEVAEAIAAGVRDANPTARVAVLPVAEAEADAVARAGLLIVGGPTHMRGMTSTGTSLPRPRGVHHHRRRRGCSSMSSPR